MKLKTLDELQKCWSVGHKIDLVVKKELREEAINWVKALRNDFPKVPNEKGDDIKINCQEKFVLIYFIKYFFNITEKDLEEDLK